MITIVTISYNQGEYLSRCIDSVLNQTGIELEYIVIDADSDDGSREIIESYGDKLTMIFGKDKGPADGLNKGFSIANGHVYGFINADDYLLPGALLKIDEHFRKHPDCDLVSGAGYIEYGATGVKKEIIPDKLTVEGLNYNSEIIFQQGTFFSSQIYEKSDKFNVYNKTCWDMEIFLDMINSGARQCVIGEKLAVFFLQEGSVTESIAGSGQIYRQYISDRRRIFFHYKSREWSWYDGIISILMRIKQKVCRLVLL